MNVLAQLSDAFLARHFDAGTLERARDVVAAGAVRRPEIGMLSDEVGDLQQKIAVQREQAHQLEEVVGLLRSESRVLEEEVRRGESAWLAAKMEAEETEQAAAALASARRSAPAVAAGGCCASGLFTFLSIPFRSRMDCRDTDHSPRRTDSPTTPCRRPCPTSHDVNHRRRSDR